MDLKELIVQTKADYVNLVVRLVADLHYRGQIRHQIEQRRSVLFDDQSAMGSVPGSFSNRSRGPSVRLWAKEERRSFCLVR